ncbi:MAG: hypothetical protein JRH06_16455 [Deltaproteobacteria bacterium]|nr:hypothetical protein [Deltaproteobacteria bacterium]MBW2139129.1 hypothetical protein [Deltaproteobacteria bacterium]
MGNLGSYETERREAVEAVLKACRLCESVRMARVSGGVIAKEGSSPVTVADFGAQAAISAHLADCFPNDLLVSEEDSHLLRQPRNAPIKEAVLGCGATCVAISLSRHRFQR